MIVVVWGVFSGFVVGCLACLVVASCLVVSLSLFLFGSSLWWLWCGGCRLLWVYLYFACIRCGCGVGLCYCLVSLAVVLIVLY